MICTTNSAGNGWLFCSQLYPDGCFKNLPQPHCFGNYVEHYNKHDLDEMYLIEIKELGDVLGYGSRASFIACMASGKGFEDGLKRLHGAKNASYMLEAYRKQDNVPVYLEYRVEEQYWIRRHFSARRPRWREFLHRRAEST